MLAIGMTTAPRTPSFVDQSLSELRRGGFRQTIHVFAEPGAEVGDHPHVVVHRNPRPLGMWPNWRHSAMTLLVESQATHFLLCEDDFLLADDACNRLENAIRELPQDDWGYASLYTARHSVQGRRLLVAGWQSLPPAASLWGSQAYCFTRESLRQMLYSDSIWRHAGSEGTDAIITLAMGSLKRKCYFHLPSLLEHVGNCYSTSQHTHPANFSVGFTSLPRHGMRNGKRSPPVNVGILVPSLVVGGVEHWLISNLRACNPAHLMWNVVIGSPLGNDPVIIRQVERYARVYYGQEGAKMVARDADVILIWRMYDPQTWFGDYQGPVVVTSHDTGDWIESYFRDMRSAATHFTAVSEQARDAVAPAVPRSLIHVIPNGADEDRCRPQRPRAEVRAQWGLDEHEVAVGYLGRFARKKNVPALLHGVRLLGAPYRSVLVGYDYDGPHSDEYRRIDPRAVIAPVMHHVGDAYAAFDVFVTTSDYEGGPITNLEAMLAGVPLVTTPVGQMPEIERQYGALFESIPLHPTPEQVAAAIRKALHPAARKRTRRARKIALEKYSAKRMAADWTRYLTRVVESARYKRHSRPELIASD